jgi:hypothetical protein
MSGIQRFIDLRIERSAAPQQHRQPDRRQRDKRAGVAKLRPREPGR